jgi:NAD(P)-dependent dehydrogenase (short-subunit alcohol dehydrogenase family)
MLLKDQVAIITGGGRGIGRAIARKFAEQGAAVIITARTESEIQAVAAEIQRRAAFSAPRTSL